MEKLNKNKLGLTLGTVLAFFTFIWSLMVALGWGQLATDKKLHLLFLNNPFTVLPFSFIKMVVLVIGSFVGAYILGWVSAYVWNWYNK
jgi:hypothetical protein